MTYFLPVADPSMLSTSIIISDDDGLLRTRPICTGPSFSSILYEDWLKLTVAATQIECVVTSFKNVYSCHHVPYITINHIKTIE